VKVHLDGHTAGSFFCTNSLRVYILLEDFAKNVDKPPEVLKKILHYLITAKVCCKTKFME